MDKKDKRFELRLTQQEFEALHKLADSRGVDRSRLVAGMIRQASKRAKVWK
jgi:predicted DNA binding CopG/RHH family protein